MAIPTDRVDEIQKDCKAAMSAEGRLRNAYTKAFKSLYKFGDDFDETSIVAEADGKSITVAGTAKHPHWVRVCKLAFGEEEGYAQQVNKYSNALAHAKEKKVTYDKIDDWIAENTFTKLINNARDYFGTGSGGDSGNKDLTAAIEKIEETWEPLLDAGMPTAVDLEQVKEAGIKLVPGKVEVLCEMDKDGNLKPVGIIQAGDTKLYDLIKPRAVRQAKSTLHTLGHLKDLYDFVSIIPWGVKKPRCLLVKCTAEDWTVYAANPNMVASAIVIAKFDHPHEQLPEGIYQLGSDEQKGLAGLIAQFRTMTWDIRKNAKGECEIEIKDGQQSTVQDRITTITNARKKNNPTYKFTWPTSVSGSTQTLTWEDGTNRELSRPHKTVKFGDELTFSYNLRKDIKDEWENNIKPQVGAKPQIRVRFGTNGISFFMLRGTQRMGRVQYNIGAPTGFEEFFDTDGRTFVKALDCIDAAIEKGDCKFAFSDTILRIQAITDDAEYTIMLPELGPQNTFKTNELGMGKVL